MLTFTLIVRMFYIDVSVAGSMNCLQKPFTQIEDINLSNLLHPTLERDYDRFNNSSIRLIRTQVCLT